MHLLVVTQLIVAKVRRFNVHQWTNEQIAAHPYIGIVYDHEKPNASVLNEHYVNFILSRL